MAAKNKNPAPMFVEVERNKKDGSWSGKRQFSGALLSGVLRASELYNFSSDPALFLIHEAWNRGLNLEHLADGFGPGAGTQEDWSGIRDSSEDAIDAMLTEALNFFFGSRR
jgi:hypothetical protein